jgi:hypothetical protein
MEQTIPQFDAEDQTESISPEEHKARAAAAQEGMTALEGAIRATEALKSEEIQKFEMHQRQAKLFASSGLFGGSKSKPRPIYEAIAAHFTLIEIGEGMGFTPAQSVMGIDIIQGRPAVSAQLRATKLAQLGYSWNLEWLANTKEECTGVIVWPFFKGKQMLEPKRQLDGKTLQVPLGVKYDVTDAQRMMTTLWEGPKGNQKPRRASILEKENWQMSPRNMYFSRAITNFQRWYVPHAIASNVLDTGEAQEISDASDAPQFADGTRDAAAETQERKLKLVREEVARDSTETLANQCAGADPRGPVTESASSPADQSAEAQATIFAGLPATDTTRPRPTLKARG